VADDTLRRKRLRNRWLKTVTLVNNPSLVFERLVKQYQQQMELAGNTEDDRLKLKVIYGNYLKSMTAIETLVVKALLMIENVHFVLLKTAR